MKKQPIIIFYRKLDFKEKSLFKKAVMMGTGWSSPTFQYKFREGNFSKLELKEIEKIKENFDCNKK